MKQPTRMTLENIQAAHAALCQKTKQPNQKMGQRPKQILLQRRYTDGKKGHEKMLTTTNYQRNANQNDSEVSPHTDQNRHHLKNLQINAGMGVEERESSYTVSGNINWYKHFGEQDGGSLKN